MDKRNAKRAGYPEKSFHEAKTAFEPYMISGKVIGLVGEQQVGDGLTAIPTPGHYFFRL